MTDFTFSNVLNTTLSSFDKDNDTLNLAGVSATDVTVSNDSSSVTLTTSDGFVTLPILIEEITTSNITFSDGSKLIIGDNTTSSSLDAQANNLSSAASSGADKVFGLGGNDTLDGSAGNDFIQGNGGDDALTAGTGNDTVRGGQGNDTIIGSSGTNLLLGDKGTDSITGGTGADSIYGGESQDTLIGSTGNDFIQGNAGEDSITSSSTGNDTVRGGQGADVIDYSGLTSGEAQLYGDLGNDSITGSTSVANSIYGGEGNDFITASTGSAGNFVQGNAGNDFIRGGDTGSALLRGGQGNDYIQGEDGNNTLMGDNGNDVLISDDGADSLIGGEGADIFSIDTKTGTNTIIVEDWTSEDTASFDSTNNTTSYTVTRDTINGTVSIIDDADTVRFNNITSGILEVQEDFGDSFLLVNMGEATSFGIGVTAGITGPAQLVASNNGDTLFGGSGADKLIGGDGNDRIDAGTEASGGVDTISAGAGDDTVILHDDEDDNNTDGGDGNDTLILSLAMTNTYRIGDAAGAGVTGFENIIIDNQSPTTGGIIIADTLVSGTDIVATDTVTISATTSNRGISVNDNTDGVVNLHITGTEESRFNDTIRIESQSGNITINALSGRDNLETGSGDDTINAGEGADRIYATGLGADTVVLTEQISVEDDITYDAHPGTDIQALGGVLLTQSDLIQGFTAGTDKIRFDDDDNDSQYTSAGAAPGTTTASGGSTAVTVFSEALGTTALNNASFNGVVVYEATDAVASSNFTEQSGIASAVTALTGAFTANAVANTEMYFILYDSQSSANAAMFYYEEGGVADAGVDSAELSLVAVFNNIGLGNLGSGDFLG